MCISLRKRRARFLARGRFTKTPHIRARCSVYHEFAKFTNFVNFAEKLDVNGCAQARAFEVAT